MLRETTTWSNLEHFTNHPTHTMGDEDDGGASIHWKPVSMCAGCEATVGQHHFCHYPLHTRYIAEAGNVVS
jgi:hypothetical protein